MALHLVVNMKLTATDVVDESKFEFSEISISVLQHSLGYQNSNIAFTRGDYSSQELLTTCVTPNWSNKYIPNDGFVLPTGRFFRSNNDLMLAIVGEHGFDVFKYNRENEEFFQIDVSEESVRDGLKTIDVFAPDDVYWDYALVKYGAHFGRKNLNVDFTDFVDTERLFEIWESSKTRN